MTPEEHLKAGDLPGAIAVAKEAVRRSPAEAASRILLFQLLCIVGQWDRALTQLNVLRDMDADCMLLAQIFLPVIQCEVFRENVFKGERSPLIFGEPEEWIGLLVQANHLLAKGDSRQASELRNRAFEAAPANPGKLNDQPFDWIADADTRLGPVLETIIDGKYYWVPFFRIHRIHVEPPQDLRDLVWSVAQLTWSNGGESHGFIPTRYPGSAEAADSRIALARLTEWIDRGNDTTIGLGQRMFATDSQEVPLLETRNIELTHEALS